ncbi:MAG: SDR family oxidoreductase [Hyphomicrobiales bacterium]
MQGSLDGFRALVTGASSGIGKAIAQGFAAAGASVLVNYHSHAEPAEELVREIERQGGRAVAAKGDVSKPEDCEALFDAMAEHFGGVDILMANAGIQADAFVADMTLEQWQKVIGVNLTGQFLCAQQAVRHFRRQSPVARSPALGKIVFTSSVHEEIPWAGHVNYAASKGGLKLLMESLAQELAPEKIRVNSIAPGAIKTAINEDAWKSPDAAAELLKLIPYGRIGDPEDVANAAVWLASDESDYVTGTTLFVDGGMTLFPGFREGG